MSSEMYCYRAYGLTIRSTLRLPELSEAADPPDVTIHVDTLTALPAEISKAIDLAADSTQDPTALPESQYWKNGQDIYLFWSDLGLFRIRAGKEIVADPKPHVSERRLRPAVLGICMAVLLHQRGLLVLHASAAEVNGGVVAFLGDKGWGKSTMNAMLHKRGHRFVTDDILAINLQGQQPTVYPAFGQIKLWPSAVKALGDDPNALPTLFPGLKKRQHLFQENFDDGASQQPTALKAIYLLGKGNSIDVQPLQTQAILSHLFTHSYSGRCGKALLQQGETAHFLQCMTLAKQVPFYRLQRPSDLSLLGAIAQTVETHANSIELPLA